MRQKSLSPDGFDKYLKIKKKFLNEMEAIISWKELTEIIEPLAILSATPGGWM